MSAPKPWPFEKIVFRPSPALPSIDIEPMSAPLEPAGGVVCVVCSGLRNRPAADGAEPRPCTLCGGTGMIGGGE